MVIEIDFTDPGVAWRNKKNIFPGIISSLEMLLSLQKRAMRSGQYAGSALRLPSATKACAQMTARGVESEHVLIRMLKQEEEVRSDEGNV